MPIGPGPPLGSVVNLIRSDERCIYSRCANGYFGNPLVPGGSCVPCDCNGNIDPFVDGHCDSLTGECLRCIGNTAGRHCERCEDGFYGDAILAKNCTGNIGGLSTALQNAVDKPLMTLATVLTHRITATQELANVFALQTPMDQNVNTVMPTTGAMIQSLDVWTATVAGKGRAGSSVTLQLVSAHAERSLVGRPAMLVYSDTENTPVVLLVTVMPKEPSLLGAMMSRKYAAVKKNPEPVLARICQYLVKATVTLAVFGQYFTSVSENVFGSYCNECKGGTFALRTDNPLGCSPCFCSGMSQLCAEIEDYVHIP
ncbi:unnamed protein product, partial [Ranitomeya imitator]